MPANCQNSSPPCPHGGGRQARAEGAMHLPVQWSPPMKTERPDPNAELHARERLRIVFAIGALLLGLLAAAQA